MLHKVFTLFSIVSIGVLIYYWINGGQYNTVFLPVLEGTITAGLILFAIVYKKAKAALIDNRLVYLPIITSILFVLVVVLVNIASNSFGSERIAYIEEDHNPLLVFVSAIISTLFFPLGGIGIPLGMVISLVWPLLSLLGTFASSFILLLIPFLFFVTEFKEVASVIRYQSSNKPFYINIIFPLLIGLLIIPILSILSILKVQSVINEENVWQLNHDSYETGKEIQHALEGSMYRGGKYYEKFPESLSKLVGWGLIEAVPLSPIDNRAYEYTLDPDGKNYTLCFPQTGGERCEDSWSRE